MSPLRVLHLITRLELGGAQLNTVATCRGLDPTRFEPHLACGPGGVLVPAGIPAPHLHEVASLVRSIDPRADLRAARELDELIARLRPDIVHTHSSKAGILGRRAAKRAGVPVVIHSVHGFAFSPGQFWPVRLTYQWLERRVAPLTDHFVFVSRADLAEGRRLGLCGDNASLIRSGFELDRFQRPVGTGERLRRQLGIPEGAVVCGTIAPFKPQKGLLFLLGIAARVATMDPRVHFVIAGDGVLRPRLEAEIRRRGLGGRFHLPGFVERVEEMIDLFDIGVSTARWEGLPQSVVQLRLRKVPLVVSDIPAHREVVTEGENGLIADVRDEAGFAGKILLLAGDETLRRRIGDFTDDFAEWDLPVMVHRQEELYERLAGERCQYRRGANR